MTFDMTPPPYEPDKENEIKMTVEPKASVPKYIWVVLAGAFLLAGVGFSSPFWFDTDKDSDQVEQAETLPEAVAPTTINRPSEIGREPNFDNPTFNDSDELSNEEIQRLAMDMAWSDTSASDRRLVCEGIDLFGMEESVQIFNSGAEFVFDEYIIEEKFREWC